MARSMARWKKATELAPGPSVLSQASEPGFPGPDLLIGLSSLEQNRSTPG
jgi:hypothetical protein